MNANSTRMDPMQEVSLRVNGKKVASEVSPRTHLADFLREDLRLTGTHIGCEHGVCGACTVLVDGRPVRSCITFTVACEGRQVTTVEGYDDDPIMSRVREAFHRHHALQCGFCTPGMLATARDIVLRLPDANEHRVRIELAGNLCRCTGYMGIVAAVRSVLEDLRNEPDAAVEALRAQAREGKAIGAGMAASAGDSVTPSASRPFKGFDARPLPAEPVGAAADAADAVSTAAVSAAAASTAASAGAAASAMAGTASGLTAGSSPGLAKGNRIEGRFDVPFPAAQVWKLMVDLPAVATCLPGASVTSADGDRVKGLIAIKFGPMSASFDGEAQLKRDDAAMSALFSGSGQDSLSRSRAVGDIGYRLESMAGGSAQATETTRVRVEMVYSLQGPLAQFSRSGLVDDFVRRMIAEFGRNVTARLKAPEGSALPSAPAPLNPVKLFFGVLWDRVRRLLGLDR